MTPTWYDLLGVESGASADEIRAAWREAVADLDPTDRRFAVLNRAAKVLLDPASRAAYDAELAEQPDEADEASPDPASAGEATSGARTRTVTAPVAPAAAATPTVVPSSDTGSSDTGSSDTGSTDTGLTDSGPPQRRGSLVTTILALVIALALGAIAVVAVLTSDSETAIENSTSEARSTAEEAVVPILSYDATDLEAGRSTATSFLTDDFAEKYDRLFEGVIRDNASDLGVRVETKVLASGVIRADLDRVQVLLFADQTRYVSGSTEGQTYSNQVTVTLARVDDEWLVDDLDTTVDQP